MTFMPVPRSQSQLAAFLKNYLGDKIGYVSLDICFAERPTAEHEYTCWTYEKGVLKVCDGVNITDLNKEGLLPRVKNLSGRIPHPLTMTVFGWIKPDATGEANATHISSLQPHPDKKKELRTEFIRRRYLESRMIKRYGGEQVVASTYDAVFARCWELLQQHNGKVGALHISVDKISVEPNPNEQCDLNRRFLLLGKVDLNE